LCNAELAAPLALSQQQSRPTWPWGGSRGRGRSAGRRIRPPKRERSTGSSGSAAVGDRGVILARGGPSAAPGDEHRSPVRADRRRKGAIAAVAGAVIALHPQLGAGNRRRVSHLPAANRGACGARVAAPETLSPVTPAALSATPAAAATHTRVTLICVGKTPCRSLLGRYERGVAAVQGLRPVRGSTLSAHGPGRAGPHATGWYFHGAPPHRHWARDIGRPRRHQRPQIIQTLL
jgi:hypothetical protein